MLKATERNAGHHPRATILPVKQREGRLRKSKEFRRYDPRVGNREILTALRDIQLRGINGARIELVGGQEAYVFEGGPLAIEYKRARASSLDMRTIDPESVRARFDLVLKRASMIVTENMPRALRSSASGRVEPRPDDHTPNGICHLKNSCYHLFFGLEGPEVEVKAKSILDPDNQDEDQNLRVETIKTSLDRTARLINTKLDRAKLSAEQYQDFCARLRRSFSLAVARVLADIVTKELQKELAYCCDGTRKSLNLTLKISEHGMVAPWWYIADGK